MKPISKPPPLPDAPLSASGLVFLAVWMGVALWGWFWVDHTVLGSSPLALRFVNAVTTLTPWLEGVRNIGASTDKGLLLQCVSYVACAPVAVWYTLASAVRIHQRTHEPAPLTGLLLPLASFLFVLVLFGRRVSAGEQAFFAMGHWVFIDPWTAPMLGPVVAFGTVGLPTLFCYLVVITLTDTPAQKNRT